MHIKQKQFDEITEPVFQIVDGSEVLATTRHKDDALSTATVAYLVNPSRVVRYKTDTGLTITTNIVAALALCNFKMYAEVQNERGQFYTFAIFNANGDVIKTQVKVQ